MRRARPLLAWEKSRCVSTLRVVCERDGATAAARQTEMPNFVFIVANRGRVAEEEHVFAGKGAAVENETNECISLFDGATKLLGLGYVQC